MNKWIVTFIFSMQLLQAVGQESVNIAGKITDAADKRIAIPGCIVVNMRTQLGILANEDGTFSIAARKSDTIAFRTIGYELKFISLNDSASQNGYQIHVALKRQSYQLNEVTIIPHRTLDSISNDMGKLGYDEGKYMLQGIDALQSPVTALYQMFSRKEKSRREVAFMMNEDERRKLLRELLQYYVSSGYLKIKEKDYDRFIAYCGINEAQMKTLTQYEMAVYIKRKYEVFSYNR